MRPRIRESWWPMVHPGRWSVWRFPSGRWAASPGDAETSATIFPTHAEAIAYADRMARVGE